MSPMTLIDLKSLELWNITEGANRPGWFVAMGAGSNAVGDRHRVCPTTLVAEVGVALLVLLTLLVLGSATVA
jgi:hypothetical protein